VFIYFIRLDSQASTASASISCFFSQSGRPQPSKPRFQAENGDCRRILAFVRGGFPPFPADWRVMAPPLA